MRQVIARLLFVVKLRNHADNIFVRQEDDSSFDEEEYVDFLKKLYNTDEL